VLNGKQFTVNDLQKLPARLRPENLSTKTENGITVFYTRNSIFSNFNMKYPIEIDNTVFNSPEQYFQHKKAVVFGDHITADRIMQSDNPYAQKQFGKDINARCF
jgi:predicted NAD-dependent protein-ADP-ribosyltransferase YbiA (DUF1768 family)